MLLHLPKTGTVGGALVSRRHSLGRRMLATIVCREFAHRDIDASQE
jgi:hypothetical protein